ncbi:MAG: hypothetical protein DRP85_00750 [Candidatus Makaraimicrobium thalassicum]|nr:MAG: hypothetical protein DRP85_00750 [Candidatus Omnitrophota bacterium]
MRALGKKVFTEEERELLRKAASNDLEERKKYQRALAQVLDGAFRGAVLEDDTLNGVFQRVVLEPGVDPRFPLHFLSPGEEEDYVAFVIAKEGAPPQRLIEGDEVYVPTYTISNSIDIARKYVRDARWDVVADAMDVLKYGFTRKLNDDGWHTIISAAVENGRVVDSSAAAGTFTKKLLTGMMTAIKRFPGGRRSKLTDLFLSPEALADIRNWSQAEVDDITRHEIFRGEGLAGLPTIFGVRLHELQELGEGQRFQTYIESTDGPNKASWFVAGGDTDKEFCIGLDASDWALRTRKFVVREDLQLYEDDTLLRSNRVGWFGFMEIGFAVLDNRFLVIGTF